MDIRNLLRENIKNLAPYSTARDEYQGDLGVYLDANENPYNNGYNRYPDPYQRFLKKRISEIKNIPVENIFIGNGSDEPIDLLYRMFCEPGKDNAVIIAPSYGMYGVSAAINNVEVKWFDLDDSFEFRAEDLLSKVDPNTKLIFLCSPNNPSGNLLDYNEVIKVIEGAKNSIVVVDEAYIDFADSEGFLARIKDYENLVVLQTLSKMWGLAGLRLGLCFAGSLIVETMTKVKYPYNINIVTQKIVLDHLADISGILAQKEEIKKQRDFVVNELAKNSLVKYIYPSDANFILARFDEPRKIYDALISEGVIVRDRSKVKGCDGCLRITIGTPDENQTLINIMNRLQANK